jgi:hypothetical protein
MGGRRSRVARELILASLVLPLATITPRDVEACGGFFGGGKHKPSLSYEQVLILHDPINEKEHFIREVAFHGGSEPFGFVVPTPTQPEVAKVDKSPFDSLRYEFPFVFGGGGFGTGTGFGNGHGKLGGVSVLGVSKVGSFTAFVLAADDEKGLAQWLRDNGLTSTADADAWLAHYVRMKFYFVAMRYDPPPPRAADASPAGALPSQDAGGRLKAETIRISFSTPVPYYPYLEPKRPPEPPGSPPARLLELWLATPARLQPISARTAKGQTSWVRPMVEGTRVPPLDPAVTRSALAKVLGDLSTLMPTGPVVVQTFQDQKLSREGYDDILFVPEAKTALHRDEVEKLRPLLGILDPLLVPQKGER